MGYLNNVFHILLTNLYIVLWVGPNCLGKSTPFFRIYYMIRNYAEISFSPCVYNHSHCMNMAISGCDVYMLLYFDAGVYVTCGDS